MNSRSTLRWRCLTALFALALSSAACAGSDAPAEEEPAAEEPAAEEPAAGSEAADAGSELAPAGSEAPAAELEPIRAMFATLFAVPSIGDTAEALGIWDEMGLDVELLEGQEIVPALASGDVDMGVSSPNRFIGGILGGAELKMVGPTGNTFDQWVVVRTELGLETLEELEAYEEPLSVGISNFGSAGHFGSEKLAQELSWEEGADYEIVPLGGLDAIRAGMESGQVDLFLWSAGGAFAIEESGDAVLAGNVGEFVGPIPFNVIVASDAAIAEKPESVRAFCEGFYEAQSMLQEDPEMATQVLVEDGGLDPETTPRVVDEGIEYLATSDEMPEEGWEAMVEATEFTIEGVEGLTADQVREMYVPCSSL